MFLKNQLTEFIIGHKKYQKYNLIIKIRIIENGFIRHRHKIRIFFDLPHHYNSIKE